MVPDNAGVIRSQTLPEFAFRLQDLEEIFELETFVDDPLYSPFLLKRFQKERKEKENALQREKEALAEVEGLWALLKNQWGF